MEKLEHRSILVLRIIRHVLLPDEMRRSIDATSIVSSSMVMAYTPSHTMDMIMLVAPA